MFGVQIFYILLFSTIQIGAGGYFIASNTRNRLKHHSRDIVILSGLLLCYNVCVLMDLWTAFELVEGALLFLPTVLFWHFTRNLHGNKEINVSKIRTATLLLSAFGLTILVWYLLKTYAGLGIVTIAPVLIILYSITGFVLSIQMKVKSEDRARWLIVGLIVSGFVLLVLTSVQFTVEGDLGSHLTINFLYLFILLEFIVRNFFDLLHFSPTSEADEDVLLNQVESGKYSSLDGYGLTKTERIIAEYLLDGLSFQEISDRTGKKINTLYQHAHKIYNKTGTTQQTFLLQFVITESSPDQSDVLDNN